MDYWNKYGLFSPYTPSEINLMNYVITYNGEIYNYKELREQLIALGFLFQSESDTEADIEVINVHLEKN